MMHPRAPGRRVTARLRPLTLTVTVRLRQPPGDRHEPVTDRHGHGGRSTRQPVGAWSDRRTVTVTVTVAEAAAPRPGAQGQRRRNARLSPSQWLLA
jgi:hypothetical protein